MQKHNLQCRVKKKRRFKADQGPEMIAPNLLARSFTATAPNEKWVTDHYLHSIWLDNDVSGYDFRLVQQLSTAERLSQQCGTLCQ